MPLPWKAASNYLRSTAATLGIVESNNLQKGALIAIGRMKVEVIEIIAEGGFAFVYKVKDVQSHTLYALKRLLVNDPEDVGKVREEIDFMKQIPKHKNIVEFHAAGIFEGLPNGGTEVLIVMQLCPEPSLYEILDKRFKQYFKEEEVLDIFSEICEGVAHLHSLSPPVAHRDLKVENVLKYGNTYKLCDFGSATTKTFLPTNSSSINRIEDELNRYTTPAYRSPEMLDLWQKHQIDEKVDIWALGCLLFRICFFVHPFDDGTNLQIINVKYEIPDVSPYSVSLHSFIRFLIQPDPTLRPSIFTVMKKLSEMRGVSNPVSEIKTRKDVSLQNPQNVPNSSFFAPSSKHVVPSSGDAFSMLDWHEADGTKVSAPSAPTASSVSPLSNPTTHDVFDPFADFSAPTTGSSGAVQNDLSFFSALDSSAPPKASTIPSMNSSFEISFPTSDNQQRGGVGGVEAPQQTQNLVFGAFSSAPPAQTSPFSSTNSLSGSGDSLGIAGFPGGQAASNLFGSGNSVPVASNSALYGSGISTNVIPLNGSGNGSTMNGASGFYGNGTSHPSAPSSTLYGSGGNTNLYGSGGNTNMNGSGDLFSSFQSPAAPNSALPPSFPYVGHSGYHSGNNMNGSGNSMNRNAVGNMEKGSMGSLFDSVANTAGTNMNPPQQTKTTGTAQPLGNDLYSGLRNL